MIQKLESLDWLVRTYNLLKGGIKVIIKNVTISIKDGKASLSDKIILYQQDNGIEICFTHQMEIITLGLTQFVR